MAVSGWIGVDLDGTLAEYHGWNGGAIGRPIQAMVDRVKNWLAEGTEVRIFTARVACSGLVNDVGQEDSASFVDEQRRLVEDWCLTHIGQVLEVTATKDFKMAELWDDRAVTVEANTGRVLSQNRARGASLHELLVIEGRQCRLTSASWDRCSMGDYLRGAIGATAIIVRLLESSPRGGWRSSAVSAPATIPSVPRPSTTSTSAALLPLERFSTGQLEALRIPPTPSTP